MSTEVLLVRHGQTESNRTGHFIGWLPEDLNSAGLDQAQRLSRRLSALKIDLAVASPLKRALHTAEIIAAPHGIELRSMDDLKEINQGELEGKHRSETEKRYPLLWQQLISDPSGARFPGGESFSQVAQRTLAAFESVTAQNRDKRILLVAHEINLKIIVMQALGVPHSVYRRFDIENASLSLLQSRGDFFRLITLNDTSHLV